MPRRARKKSSSGIYHVVLRGINKQRIFEDDQDNQKGGYPGSALDNGQKDCYWH